MMIAFRVTMLVIIVISALGAIADKDKNKFVLLLTVCGALFLCSFLGGVR